MSIKLFAVTALLSLSGCAGLIKTNEVKEGRAKRVPDDRLLAFQAQSPSAAKIIVIRDTGFLGSGCYLGLEVSRKLAARFDPGEAASFYLEPGTVELSVVADPLGRGLCVAGLFDPVREKYVVSTDRVITYRLSSRQYRRPELEEVEESQPSRPATPVSSATTPAAAAPSQLVPQRASPAAVNTATGTASAPASPVSPQPPAAVPPPPVPTPAAAAAPQPPAPPAPPAQVQPSGPVPVGQDSFSAARLAREMACHPQPTAVLTAKGPGFESYSVSCTNGDALAIRCEFGTCRVLR